MIKLAEGLRGKTPEQCLLDGPLLKLTGTSAIIVNVPADS